MLLWRIAFLALGYALPLGGLAIFFLLSGVRWRIAAGEKERIGLQYIRQLAVVHEAAVRSVWTDPTGGTPVDVLSELHKLTEIEREVMPHLAGDRVTNVEGSDLSTLQLRNTWDEAAQDDDDRSEKVEGVTLFLGEIHAQLAQAADLSGLNSSPDLETEYVADVIAGTLPAHVERLLHMHEQLLRLAPLERSRSEHLSAVFLRQLERERPRLDRSLQLAIEHDLRSAHVTEEFQRTFPAAADTFRKSTLRLADDLRADGNLAPYWDGVFAKAHAESMQFWKLAIDQLDVLLADQIAHAKRERNVAIALSILMVVTLVPLTWAYFRRYVRPLVQDLVDEVQENADASAKAKNQFLAMMSHEIRTPMNGVIGFAQLLADTPLTAEQRDYLRTILVSGESLLVVINDILDFSKLEAGKTELEKQPLALRQLVEDALELLATQARAKNLELVYDIEPGTPEGIVGDAARLRQILLNLLGNAVKFTPKGHVEVAVKGVPSGTGRAQLTFHVRDTGIGISADRIHRLFQAFSQVDASISRTYGGTGLGLAITQKLLELMGGRIAVTSVPGKGSDFHFTLPVEVTAVPPSGSSSASPFDIGGVLRARSILVVDDLEPNRRLVERFLVYHGARVMQADSADSALVIVRHHQCDLALLDFMMPGKDGLSLAREIRAVQPALPMLLLTSVPPEQAQLPTGLFAEVLLKPLRHQPFAAAIARALQETAAPAPAGARADATSSAFAKEHPLKIVVVDDNAVNRKVIVAMLKAFGYAPAEFADAAGVLAALRGSAFDLVLMDVQMPDMDGLEATRRIRNGDAGENHRQVRIVALTAGAMPEERAACMKAGMDDFMAKPISKLDLQAKLAAAARSARPTP